MMFFSILQPLLLLKLVRWLCSWYQGHDKNRRWRLILWLTCNTQIIVSDHWGVIIVLVLKTCQIRGKICSQWNPTKYFTGFCIWAWLHGTCSRCTNGYHHAVFDHCNVFFSSPFIHGTKVACRASFCNNLTSVIWHWSLNRNYLST